MHRLFYDIASHQAVFAIVSNERVFSQKTVDGIVRDDQVPSFVLQVLKEAHLSFADLTSIACVTGPGGFTSLRVAVTYANVLGDQLGIPVAGVHLADLRSAQCTETDAVWIHSTKKGEVFIRGVSERVDHWSWPDAAYLPLPDALAGITSSLWYGELIPDHREVLEAKGLREATLRPLSDVLPIFLRDLHYSKKQIVPWYGRRG